MDVLATYDRIPTRRYCSGCHSCAIRCSGDVPLAEQEWSRMGDYLRERRGLLGAARVIHQDKTFSLGPEHSEQYCLLYDTDRRECSVYEARPLVCRLLGFVEWMPCPIGRALPRLPDGREVMLAYAELGLRPMSEWLRLAPIDQPLPRVLAWEAVG